MALSAGRDPGGRDRSRFARGSRRPPDEPATVQGPRPRSASASSRPPATGVRVPRYPARSATPRTKRAPRADASGPDVDPQEPAQLSGLARGERGGGAGTLPGRDFRSRASGRKPGRWWCRRNPSARQGSPPDRRREPPDAPNALHPAASPGSSAARASRSWPGWDPGLRASPATIRRFFSGLISKPPAKSRRRSVSRWWTDGTLRTALQMREWTQTTGRCRRAAGSRPPRRRRYWARPEGAGRCGRGAARRPWVPRATRASRPVSERRSCPPGAVRAVPSGVAAEPPGCRPATTRGRPYPARR